MHKVLAQRLHKKTKTIMRMFPRGITVLLALYFLSFNSVPAMAGAPNGLSQPNIVLILIDDQGWGDIGYNNANVYTPHMDRLATTGTILTQHYVMPQCTPTRVALLTGRYPSRFGGAALAASNEPAFPKGTPTLASMLKQRGYETFLCGKWHLGSYVDHGPMQFGFSECYGSLAGACGMYDHRYRKGKFYETWHRNQVLIEGSENGTHATELLTREALRFLRRKRNSPFFLYLPYHSVHTPLDERGPFTEQPTKLDESTNRWINEGKIRWFNDPAGKIQRELDPEKRLFLAALYHLDDSIGRIIGAIDELGIREDTLILVSSDNGPQVNWPGNAYPHDLKLTQFNQPIPLRGKKTDVWEGGIHVPGFVNWPSRIGAKKLDAPVHIIDWLPTIEKLTRTENDPFDDQATPFDGVDLSDYWQNGNPPAERSLYWVWNSSSNRWALRRGNWKIVKYGRGAPKRPQDWQLFDLEKDPKETRDVSLQNPDITTQMHGYFLQQRQLDNVKTN